MYTTILRRLPAVVATLLAAALALAVLAPLASARGVPEDVEGRDLFRGLLLGTGEVADALPEVFGKVPEQPEEARKAEELLLAQAEELDPEFFDSFAERISSGDHVLVDEALNEGSALLNEVVADGRILEELGYHIPYHWTWLPYRWHYRFQPYLWDYGYRYIHNYNFRYGFDYDGTLRYRYFVRWNPELTAKMSRFELDPESKLANERFVDLVVERFSY